MIRRPHAEKWRSKAMAFRMPRRSAITKLKASQNE